jgi:hypothetical protein
VIQNSIFKTTEKVEEFRQQMNWNKDQLEQWVIAEKQKEDDNIQFISIGKSFPLLSLFLAIELLLFYFLHFFSVYLFIF